jgi:hypothetical protein
MNADILTGIVLVETALWCTGAFLLCRRWGMPFAEAVVYAFTTVLMSIAFIHQLACLTGIPLAAPALEGIFTVGFACSAFFCRSQAKDTFRIFLWFISRHPVVMAGFVIGWSLLGWQALFSPFDANTISGLSAIQECRGVLGDGPFPPPNAGVLPFHFSRVSATLGGGITGFLAYLIICFSTYTLSRRYAWPPTAITVTAVVAGFSRLVYLARSSEIEIATAASAMFCILSVYRMLEQHDVRDMMLFVAGICFSISDGPMGLAFPAILTAYAALLLHRRHGATAWPILMIQHRRFIIPALIPVMVFSQLWRIAAKNFRFDAWLSSVGVSYNADGLQGGLANLLRYFLQMLNLPDPADRFFRWAFGFSPLEVLQRLYDLLIFPVFKNLGAVSSFRISWHPGLANSWFGPVATLLVIPAIGYAIFRGPRRIKSLGIAMTGYLYLISLIYAWSPGSVFLFTRFFAAGGFFISFLMPPWRLTQTGTHTLQAISLFLFAHALLT